MNNLVTVKQIFEELSCLFSTASVPLIVDVLPAFDDLRVSLELLRDYEDTSISSVLRVAAQAALLMVDKYEKLSWDCDIYYVAIGEPPFLLSSINYCLTQFQ